MEIHVLVLVWKVLFQSIRSTRQSSAIAYLAMGDLIVGALYQTGAFGEAQTLITWGVLSMYALGLPASASSRVLSSAFYALRDTRTPANMAYLNL